MGGERPWTGLRLKLWLGQLGQKNKLNAEKISFTMKIKDPLNLPQSQIKKYKARIIQEFLDLGRSKKAAQASANRWEASLVKTRLEFDEKKN